MSPGDNLSKKKCFKKKIFFFLLFDGLLINDKIGNFVFTRNLKFTKAPEQYCLACVKMGMTETVSGA